MGLSPFRDELQPLLAGIATQFELGDRAAPNVPRFDDFREAIKAIGSSERIAYQDDAAVDPAAAVLDPPKVRRSPSKKARPRDVIAAKSDE